MDCLIIGAAKAGTTSLFNILAGHPQIVASREKEARFFSRDDRFVRGFDWYGERYFKGAPTELVRLDASPAYLTWSEKVAPRIRQSYRNGDVSLVAILRDPVTRAYSHYWHRVRLGHESLSFADALAQEESRLRSNWDELSRTGNGKYGYLRASCYASRLRPFFEHFDRSRFLFLLQDDLRPERFQTTVKQLLTFLHLDEMPLRPSTLNAPTEARHAGLARAYNRLKRTSARTIYTTLVPSAVRRKIVPVLFRSTGYPPLDPSIEQELRVRLTPEITECQTLIGRDLSPWLPAQ